MQGPFDHNGGDVLDASLYSTNLNSSSIFLTDHLIHDQAQSQLPPMLRARVYSFLDLKTLVTIISVLSKQDRLLLFDQLHMNEMEFQEAPSRRSLKIQIKEEMKLSFETIQFFCTLASRSEIQIVSLKDMNITFILQCILSQLKNKKITVEVVVSEGISLEHFKQVFGRVQYPGLTSINFKLLDQNYSQMFVHFLRLASSIDQSISSGEVVLDMAEVRAETIVNSIEEQRSSSRKMSQPFVSFTSRCRKLVIKSPNDLSVVGLMASPFNKIESLVISKANINRMDPIDLTKHVLLTHLQIDEKVAHDSNASED